MFFNDVSSGDVHGSDTAVVGTLRSWIEWFAWPSDWITSIVVNEYIFLLKSKPKIIVVIVNLGSGVGLVWGTIGVENFTHN